MTSACNRDVRYDLSVFDDRQAAINGEKGRCRSERGSRGRALQTMT